MRTTQEGVALLLALAAAPLVYRLALELLRQYRWRRDLHRCAQVRRARIGA